MEMETSDVRPSDVRRFLTLILTLCCLLLQERIEGKRKRFVQTNRSLRNVVTRGNCECHAKLAAF